jgi:hypothetical protein
MIFLLCSDLSESNMQSYNPRATTADTYHVTQVWAVPLSLATTRGISIDFFSSSY